MNWIYSNIQHDARIELGLSPNEYCVLDLYYKTQTNPIHSVDGWAVISYRKMGQFLGFSPATIHKMVDRFVAADLMEVNPANPAQKRATKKWFSAAYESVQKVNTQEKERSKSEQNRSKSEHYKYNKSNKSESIGESAPKTEEVGLVELVENTVEYLTQNPGGKQQWELIRYGAGARPNELLNPRVVVAKAATMEKEWNLRSSKALSKRLAGYAKTQLKIDREEKAKDPDTPRTIPKGKQYRRAEDLNLYD